MYRLHPTFLLLLSICAPVFAQNLFTRPATTSQSQPWVAAADIDGDGDIDLMQATPVLDIQFWSNDGTGDLSLGAQLLTEQFDTTHVVPGDYDGDGDMDIAIGLLIGGIHVHHNNGSGIFGPAVFVSAGGTILRMRGGNADNDGRADILVELAAGISSNVRWLRGTATGTLTGGPFTALTDALDHEVLDADEDGDDDILAWVPQPGPQRLDVYLTNGGSSVFSFSAPIAAALGGIPALAGTIDTLTTGDYDADGDEDFAFVVETPNDTRIVVVLNGVGTSFVEMPLQTVAGFNNTGGHVFSGDWNGDGADEILARGTSEIRINESRGDATFGTHATIAFGSTTIRPAVGAYDLDGDGAEDIVGFAEIVMSQGTVANTCPDMPSSAFVFDFEGDGDVDLQLGSFVSQLYVNDGRGLFTPTSLPPNFYPTAPAGSAFQIHTYLDVDLDGDLDVIADRVAPPTGPFLPQIFIATHYFANDRNQTLVDLGPATVTAGQRIPAGSLARDMNGDGFVDLVSTNNVWINLTSGLFFPLPLPANWVPDDIGDVDGDGDLDILATATGIGIESVALLVNDGVFNFTPLVIFSNPNVVTARLVDIDVDTDIDTVIMSSGPGTPGALPFRASILRNEGMVAPTIFTVDFARGGGRMDIADFDDDGIPDILSSNPTILGVQELVVRRGVSSPVPTFGPGVVYSAINYYGIADLDGDGDLDLLGTEGGMNRRQRGTSGGTRRQYGPATPGSSGILPVLGANGPFRVNENVSVVGSTLIGGVPGFLTVGSAEAGLLATPFPGLNTLVSNFVAGFNFITLGPTGIPGAGFIVLPATVPPSLANTTLYLQMAFADPGGISGFSSTNGLELHFGP